MVPNGGKPPDFSLPSALKTTAAPLTVAAPVRGGRDRAGCTSGPGFRAIERGRYGQRRERLLRHNARGGLSRPLAPHARRLPGERGRAGVPPLRQQSALLQGGSRRVGGEAPGDHDPRRRQTVWARDKGPDARVAAAQGLPGCAMRYSGQTGPLRQAGGFSSLAHLVQERHLPGQTDQHIPHQSSVPLGPFPGPDTCRRAASPLCIVPEY